MLLRLSLLLAAASVTVAIARTNPQSPKPNAVTPAMRKALGKINKIHREMKQKEIDEAVEVLHREIARHDPQVFVPFAVTHLLRLAPKDTRTRAVLRRALAKGWIEEHLVRAFLVQAGDTPGPHINHLLKALNNNNPNIRKRALNALGACGKAGAPALAKLRRIVTKANADPSDYRRAYSSAAETPEHVLADLAINRIEAALGKR